MKKLDFWEEALKQLAEEKETIEKLVDDMKEKKPNPRNIEHDRAICERIDANDGCYDIYCTEEDCPFQDCCEIMRSSESKPMAQRWLKSHPKPKAEVIEVRVTSRKAPTTLTLGEVIPVIDCGTDYYSATDRSTMFPKSWTEIIPSYDHSKYRLMGRNEPPEKGDEFCWGEGWVKSVSWRDKCSKQDTGSIYIRPLKDSRGLVPEFDHSKYRLMNIDELVENGDLVHNGVGSVWINSGNYLNYDKRQSYGFTYIRPLKPSIAGLAEDYYPEARLNKCEDRLIQLERRLDAT